MKHYQDVILREGTGLPAVGSRVTVLQTGTAIKATLYAKNDPASAPIGNPVTVKSDGTFDFYVANGSYDFKISGVTSGEYVSRDIEIYDFEEILGVQDTVAPPVVMPRTIKVDGPRTFAVNAGAGETVALLGNIPSGIVPAISPNDGRLVLAGNEADGWRVVRGMVAASVGIINLSVSAAGATTTLAPIAITAPPAMTTQLGTITVTAAAALVGFQVAVVNGSGVFPWKAGMALDFSNLVFVDSGGSVLIPWIVPESIVPGVSCVPWLRCPTLASGVARAINYGVTTATLPNSSARGRRVFEFFDDFEMGWDSDLWETTILGQGWAGYVDSHHLGIPAAQIATGPYNQGVCGDGSFFYCGYDAGDGRNGLIYKYTYAGAFVNAFEGVPHNNSLSRRGNGNILSCSAGNTATGPGQSVVAEFTPDGAKVRTWDVGTGLFFGAKPNGTFMQEIPGGFQWIDFQESRPRRVAQVVNFMDDGTWSVEPLAYELDVSKLGRLLRSQGVWYRDGVLYYIADETGEGFGYGSIFRWKLETDGTGTALDTLRHLAGGERESVFHDGTNWYYSLFNGQISPLVFLPTRNAAAITTAIAGQRAVSYAKTAFTGPCAIGYRSYMRGLYPHVGLVDDPVNRTNSLTMGKWVFNGTAAVDSEAAGTSQTRTVKALTGTPDSRVMLNYEIRRRTDATADFMVAGTNYNNATVGVPALAVPLRPTIGVVNGGVANGGNINVEYIYVRKLDAAAPAVVVN